MIQFLELSALLGRVAGVHKNSVVIGYSIQQSVYMVTRFFVIGLLPLLGLVIDMGVSAKEFALSAHLCLLAATILGTLSFFFVSPIVGYYSGVIERYKAGGGFIRSFIGRGCNQIPFVRPEIRAILSKKEALRTLLQANFVFLIYSTGLFVSFYFALVFYDYRVSISQMSGVVNAFGAVILTLIVEPKISRSIDSRDKDVVLHIFALFWGRLLATAVTGQILLTILFNVI